MGLGKLVDNVVHKLVKYEYQPQSFEPYRHYVECSCGFQSRQSTEEAARSQYDSHLLAHGVQPEPRDVTSKEKEQEKFNPFATSQKSEIVQDDKKANWNPTFTGAKK